MPINNLADAAERSIQYAVERSPETLNDESLSAVRKLIAAVRAEPANTTAERRFRPGDRVRLTGAEWGTPGMWSEKHMGSVLTLTRVTYSESGVLQSFLFAEDDDPSGPHWRAVEGWEIELAEDDETTLSAWRPEQIAEKVVRDVMEAFDRGEPMSVEEVLARALGVRDDSTPRSILRLMKEAIEADRAQRDPNEDGSLHGAAIIALRERAENYDNAEGYDDIGKAIRAAQWIEDNPDDFWCEYAGPMLDELEREQGE